MDCSTVSEPACHRPVAGTPRGAVPGTYPRSGPASGQPSHSVMAQKLGWAEARGVTPPTTPVGEPRAARPRQGRCQRIARPQTLNLSWLGSLFFFFFFGLVGRPVPVCVCVCLCAVA